MTSENSTLNKWRGLAIDHLWKLQRKLSTKTRTLVICAGIVWALSLVASSPAIIGNQAVPVAHAQTEDTKVVATVSGTQVNLTWTKITGASRYSIMRSPSNPISFAEISTTLSGETVTYADSPGAGTFVYRIDTTKSDGSNLIGGTQSAAVTIGGSSSNTGTTSGTTTGTTSPLTQGCDQNTAGAAQAARTASNTVARTSLFETIAGEGTRKVFRWVLSLVNLIVLFFLLVVAIANIVRLQVDTYAIKKVLPPLLLGVILANFSWLICRFVVEVSTVLYNEIVRPYPGGGTDLFRGIAQRGYGLDNICNAANGTTIGLGSTVLGAIVGTALIVVAAVLIATLYLLLVARIWVVTLLMIFAPLAFLALGFPPTQTYFKKWMTLFLNWTLMAPASFLVLRIADVSTSIGSGPNVTRYVIVTALLYYAIQVPFKMGGDWMRQWGGYVSQFKKKTGNFAMNNRASQALKASVGANAKELEMRAQTRLNKTRTGKWFQRRKENVESRRKELGLSLDKSRTEPRVDFYKNTERGKARAAALGMTEREKERVENELHTAQGHAVVHAIEHDDEHAAHEREAGRNEAGKRRLELEKEINQKFSNLSEKERAEKLAQVLSSDSTYQAAIRKTAKFSVNEALVQSRLEHMLDEADLKKRDESAEAEVRMNIISSDPEVIAAQEKLRQAETEVEKARALEDARRLDLIQADPVLRDLYEKEKEEAKNNAELKKQQQDIKNEIKRDLRDQNPGYKDKRLDKMATEEYERRLAENGGVNPIAELENKLKASKTGLTDLRTKLDPEMKKIDSSIADLTQAAADAMVKQTRAESELLQKRINASLNSYEARADRISVDDALKENSTEIAALFSQTTGITGNKRKFTGEEINARRAVWRSFIKDNETVTDMMLDKMIKDMVSLDKGRVNELFTSGYSPENKKKYANFVSKLVDKMATNNVESVVAKEMVAKEQKKNEVRILSQMLHSQNFLDSIDRSHREIEVNERHWKKVVGNLAEITDQLNKTPQGAPSRTDLEGKQKLLLERQLLLEEQKRAHQEKLFIQQEQMLKAQKQIVNAAGGDIYKLQDSIYARMVGGDLKLGDGRSVIELIKQEAVAQGKKPLNDDQAFTEWSKNRKQYDEKYGRVASVDNWRFIPTEAWPEGRKMYDRLRGSLGEVERGRTSGVRSSKPSQQIHQDLYGDGDDIHSEEFAQALKEGRIADAMELAGTGAHVGGGGYGRIFGAKTDPRSLLKGMEAIQATLENAKQRREGSEARAADIDTNTDRMMRWWVTEFMNVAGIDEKASKFKTGTTDGDTFKEIKEVALDIARERDAHKDDVNYQVDKALTDKVRSLFNREMSDQLISLIMTTRRRAVNDPGIENTI